MYRHRVFVLHGLMKKSLMTMMQRCFFLFYLWLTLEAILTTSQATNPPLILEPEVEFAFTASRLRSCQLFLLCFDLTLCLIPLLWTDCLLPLPLWIELWVAPMISVLAAVPRLKVLSSLFSGFFFE